MKMNLKKINIFLFILYLICLLFNLYRYKTPAIGELTYLEALQSSINLNIMHFDLSFSMFLTSIIKFLPFSYFLPVIFDRYKDSGRYVRAIILIIVMLEFLQGVLLRGYCDIYDILLGILSCLICYFIYKKYIMPFKMTL